MLDLSLALPPQPLALREVVQSFAEELHGSVGNTGERYIATIDPHVSLSARVPDAITKRIVRDTYGFAVGAMLVFRLRGEDPVQSQTTFLETLSRFLKRDDTECILYRDQDERLMMERRGGVYWITSDLLWNESHERLFAGCEIR